MTRPAVAAILLLAFAARASAICTANGALPTACPAATPGKPHYRITRDAYGVPHVKARSLYDVGYATGIAQAEDRLFQMEFVRKSAIGNLAEIAGRDQLGSDEDTRRQFYSEEERAYLFSTLRCDLKSLVQGYVDGVNAYVAEIYADATLARVPHEFFFLPTVVRIQGNGQIPTGVRYTIETIGGREVFKPDAWRTADVVAVGALLAGRFGSGGGRQLRQAALLNYLTELFTRTGAPGGQAPADAARDVFEDVRWLNDPKAPTTIPKTGAINPVRGGHTPIPLASAAPATRWALGEGLRSLLEPPPALAALPDDPGAAQRAFVQGLDRSTVLRGLAAAERMRRHAEELNRRFGVFVHSGSNSWVVAPERSASGNALLWGGPQEGFDNPNIDWEAYILSPHMKAGGMMIAGVPGVLIGETTRFAFTTTSGEIDNSTLYVETLQAPAFPEPQSDSASYAFLLDGVYHPMDRRIEVIHFAGEDSSRPPAYAPAGPALNAGPLRFNVFRVNDCDPAHFHGYVMEFDLAASPPRAFTYKTAYWKNETSTVQGFLSFGLDRTFDDFAASVDQVVSLHNFFYADRRGNIAYWSAGARPAFPAGFDDRLPADGTGTQEWGLHPGGQRYLPFSRSLVSVNPTQGWLTNWNTKPADRSYIQEGNSHDEHWGEIYRSDRMAFLLAHNAQMTFEDVQAIEYDVGSMDGSTDTVRAAAPFLVPIIRQAYDALVAANSPLVEPATHPTLATAIDVLDEWNAYLADLSKILSGRSLRAGLQPLARPARHVDLLPVVVRAEARSVGRRRGWEPGGRVRRHGQLRRPRHRRQRLRRRDDLQHVPPSARGRRGRRSAALHGRLLRRPSRRADRAGGEPGDRAARRDGTAAAAELRAVLGRQRHGAGFRHARSARVGLAAGAESRFRLPRQLRRSAARARDAADHVRPRARGEPQHVHAGPRGGPASHRRCERHAAGPVGVHPAPGRRQRPGGPPHGRPGGPLPLLQVQADGSEVSR